MVYCAVKLSGNRDVEGILRGFDQFMNIVVEDTMELLPNNKQDPIGMTVRTSSHIRVLGGCNRWLCVALQVIRGNSIVRMICLEKL